MRVLHLAPAIFGPRGVTGGAERYVLELARHMAEVVPTRLVTFGSASEQRRVGSLDVRVLGRPWHVRGQASNPVAPAVLPEIFRADVVHCHQTHILLSSLSAAACRASGRRVFTTELGGGGWDVSAYVSTDRWFHGHLHISEYSRAIYGHAGKAWAKVILGGVDATRFTPGAAPDGRGAALFVGRLLPHKGVRELIAALPAVLPLEIIGPAPEPGYLDMLHEAAAGKQVTFRHEVGDEELVEAYRRARCVVLPSLYRTAAGAETMVPELLGQTLLEAMACGAPVICTRVASLPEIVDEGCDGFIVAPGDGEALRARLCWFATHRAEARAMGERGRSKVVAQFQWARVVQRCLDAYAS